MPDTSSDFFTSVGTSGTGNVWSNKDNVLSDATGQSTSNAVTLNLELDLPLSGSEIPPGNVITDIEFRIQWFRSAGNTVNGELQITNGDTKVFVISEPPSTGEVYPGDLAYWNITQNQALDFAQGMDGQKLRLKMVDGPNSVAVGWVECKFTYEAGFTGTVSPPAVF